MSLSATKRQSGHTHTHAATRAQLNSECGRDLDTKFYVINHLQNNDNHNDGDDDVGGCGVDRRQHHSTIKYQNGHEEIVLCNVVYMSASI